MELGDIGKEREQHSLQDLFDVEFQKVIENIIDKQIYPEDKRKIQINVIFTPQNEREILFRGKREKTGEWVEGCLITRDDPFLHDIVVPIGNSSQITYAVTRGTACQYTGINDVNGKRIFEGDIIKEKGLKAVCIVFDEKTVSLGWVFLDYFKSGGRIRKLNKNRMRDMKIIGNRWDNPELLEVRV
jgi:uncharacterized phage protein (TIGR01671 family)